jgi:hypothetical protein
MTTAATQHALPTDAARIRELLMINLFVVFSERDPGRRLKAIVANWPRAWAPPGRRDRRHRDHGQ